jgi:hypothetical protein
MARAVWTLAVIAPGRERDMGIEVDGVVEEVTLTVLREDERREVRVTPAPAPETGR